MIMLLGGARVTVAVGEHGASPIFRSFLSQRGGSSYKRSLFCSFIRACINHDKVMGIVLWRDGWGRLNGIDLSNFAYAIGCYVMLYKILKVSTDIVKHVIGNFIFPSGLDVLVFLQGRTAAKLAHLSCGESGIQGSNQFLYWV